MTEEGMARIIRESKGKAIDSIPGINTASDRPLLNKKADVAEAMSTSNMMPATNNCKKQNFALLAVPS